MEKPSGNSLEIEEAQNALLGKMEDDVKEIVLTIASYMLYLAKKGKNLEENKKKAISVIESGKAYQKFLELIEKQKGDIRYLDQMPKAKYSLEIKAAAEGYIVMVDAKICGETSLALGAGRQRKEDTIDSLARNDIKKENRR